MRDWLYFKKRFSESHGLRGFRVERMKTSIRIVCSAFRGWFTSSKGDYTQATSVSRVVRYSAVQEQPQNLGGNIFIQSDQDAYGEISLQFTDVALGQGRTWTLVNCAGAKPFSELSIRDCQLRNVYLSVYLASDTQFPQVGVVLDNNLIEGSKLYLYQHYYGANSYLNLTARNNLLRRGVFYVTYFYNDQYYSQNPA